MLNVLLIRTEYLMLDIIVNHFAWDRDLGPVDYTKFRPFHRKEFYHPWCPILDWSNQTQAENCWIGDDHVALADLDTQSSVVSNECKYWIYMVVSNYSGMLSALCIRIIGVSYRCLL